MPKDRLNELQEKANLKNTREEDEVSIETPLKSKKTTNELPESLDFLKEVEVVKNNIKSIEGMTAEVRKMQAGIISSPNENESRRKALDEKMEEIRSLSQVVNEQLKGLYKKAEDDEKMNEEQRRKGIGDIHQADLRMKILHHGTLMAMFKKVMTSYSEGQTQFQDQMRERIVRTLTIANMHMTEEEINEALEDKRDIQFFAQQYLESTERAKLDLREIEERHQDILKLEKSIQDVRNLFIDISLLVQEQGEKIDKIDIHILQAKEYVESAVKQTEKALVSRRKFQKKKMCLIGCIALAVSVVALAITLSIVFR